MILAVCFGLLPCWNISLLPSFWRLGVILSVSILVYLQAFMVSSNNVIFYTHAAPYHYTPTSVCHCQDYAFTVVVLPIRWTPSEPNSCSAHNCKIQLSYRTWKETWWILGAHSSVKWNQDQMNSANQWISCSMLSEHQRVNTFFLSVLRTVAFLQYQSVRFLGNYGSIGKWARLSPSAWSAWLDKDYVNAKVGAYHPVNTLTFKEDLLWF